MGSRDLAPIVQRATERLLDLLRGQGLEPETIYTYGAIDIDPKYLTMHVMLRTNEECDAARGRPELIDACFAVLAECGYPKTRRQGVHIGFESIERIDEEAGGNWYHYFK